MCSLAFSQLHFQWVSVTFYDQEKHNCFAGETPVRFSAKDMTFIAGLLIIASLLLGINPAIAAPICRTTAHHNICIMSIKRSAKYHWQYRAAVKIDAEIRPVERYNCRRQERTRQDGKTVPFEPDGAGELICTLLRR